MALYLDLPVYKVCNKLYVTFVKMRRTLPREERYTIGQELDRAMVEVLVLIQRINSNRDKVPLIVRARQLVVEIQVRTRVLMEVRALSVGHFTELFDLTESLSKQLTNLHRFFQKQTISDASAPPLRDGRPESAESRFGGERQKANSMRDCAAMAASPGKGDPTANTEVTS